MNSAIPTKPSSPRVGTDKTVLLDLLGVTEGPLKKLSIQLTYF
jgi:hypothetical protein